MKTQAHYACFLSLVLGSTVGCGDDSSADAPVVDASTTDDAPGTTTSPGSTGDPSDDGEDSEAGSSAGGDRYADCDRTELASDFAVFDAMGTPGPPRWSGPGADPETGELLDDGATTYFVTSTHLQLNADQWELFLELSQGNGMALYSNPGMVATQLGRSFHCDAARTLTVWTDEGAMMDFVTSPAHAQSVSAFGTLSRGGSMLSVWDEPALASEITWASALARMSAEETYD